MADPVELEVDLAPEQLLYWLETELAGQEPLALTVRAARDWRHEAAGGDQEIGLDSEDELAAHIAFGTVEVTPSDGCWRLTLEVSDAINGGMAEDWPPVGIESDGPDEISLETFADTFAVEEIESRVTLQAETPEGRRKAERLIARILADTHQRRRAGPGGRTRPRPNGPA